jgi:hypothetical protein
VSVRCQPCTFVTPLTFSRNEGVPGSIPGVGFSPTGSRRACLRVEFKTPHLALMGVGSGEVAGQNVLAGAIERTVVRP